MAERNFRLLFLGHCGSIIGDQFYLIALPWLVFSLTGSSLMLGTVLVISGAVRAAFLLTGGALSDRFSPRALMLSAYTIGAAVTILTALAIKLDITQRWHLFILAGSFGLVEATFFPAYQSMTPLLVGPDHLVPANSLLRSAVRLMGVIGPAIAGVVIKKTGFPTAFAVDAMSFAFAFAMIWMIRISATPMPAVENSVIPDSSPPKGQPLAKSISEGVRYTTRHPTLRLLFAYMVVFEFAAVSADHIGVPSFALRRFGQAEGATALGIMASSVAAGLLIGMLLAGSLEAFKQEDRVILLMGLLMACALGSLGFVYTLVPACAALVAFGVGSGTISILIQARIQLTSERRMLGRVMSILMLGISLVEMAAYAVSGALADVDPRYVFALSSVMIVLATLVWRRNQKRQPVDRSPQPSQNLTPEA